MLTPLGQKRGTRNLLTALATGAAGAPGDVAQLESDLVVALLNAQMDAIDPTGRVRAMSNQGRMSAPELSWSSAGLQRRLGGDPEALESVVGSVLAPVPPIAKTGSLLAMLFPAFVRGQKAKKGGVMLTHYSKRDLDTVKPEFYGQGGAGAEKKRKAQYPDEWVDRSYWGVGVDRGGYVRESMLGGKRYEASVDMDSIYDLKDDPLNLKAAIPEELQGTPGAVSWMEAEAKRRGFAGAGIDNVVMMFEDVPVVPHELLGEFPTTTAGRIVNQTKKGGYTVNLKTGEVPTTGLMVGTKPNASSGVLHLPKDKPITRPVLRSWVRTNERELSELDIYLGTWIEDTTGDTFADLSKRFVEEDLRRATKFGEGIRNPDGTPGQKALFRLSDFSEHPIGDWNEFIRSPEFAQRLDLMQNRGREYLSQFANPEWWDMHGTVFERVYGTDNLEMLAGFLASTAPMNSPERNMRLATEYMRRMLADEDLLQPMWRVPDDAQYFVPHKQMGLETGRADNIRRTEAGRLDLLQQEKVRNQAMALMGDPDAGVFDRWWARIAEKPSAGVYTHKIEGQMAPTTQKFNQYEELYEVIKEIAMSRNQPVRTFTADVWTGIRETVKETDKLFGEVYKGSAVQGSSAPFHVQFEELIASKAKFVGVSVKEFEKRLRNGDAELLSLMVGAPLGAYFFQLMMDNNSRDQT